VNERPADQAVVASEAGRVTVKAQSSKRPVLRRRRRRRHRARAPPGILAFTVEEFCRQHSLGISTYYRLRQQGQGPQEMQVGGKRLISIEAAAAWRRSREAATKA
jgi:hypothetical protein